jgi:hypothetical protein
VIHEDIQMLIKLIEMLLLFLDLSLERCEPGNQTV